MFRQVVSIARAHTPAPFRPAARYVYRSGKRLLFRFCPSLSYEYRKNNEMHSFGSPDSTEHPDLPPIFHYWSNKFLLPMLQPLGFTNALECFRPYLLQVCRNHSSEQCRFLSIGSGNCEAEMNLAQWLHESGVQNFVFHCLDITAASVERATESVRQHGFQDCFRFFVVDVNKWKPSERYHSILALQSLHHVVKLETVFERIHLSLYDDGYFCADDMIGRNGHQRWPEALGLVRELWAQLPEQYRYNRQLKVLEKDFENHDCSTESFEGIRSQDILPLLIQRFYFEVFVAFGNVIDIFIDRGFGPNFDPQSRTDKEFIDRVHAIDAAALEQGSIKPTHMMAVMRRVPVERTLVHKHFTPEFCVRRPD
jgi:SAM-dependent methyltransferase